MGVFLPGLVSLLGVATFVALAVRGVWKLIGLTTGAGGKYLAGRRQPITKRAAKRTGIASLVAAAALTIVPWAADRIAEALTGWVDHDGDGMLDPYSNGRYDSADITGVTWAGIATLFILGIVGVLALAGELIRRRDTGATPS
ncbi:MAG: hypothetical protein M3P34_03420 [Actinomycetota bacterium]|nr:hypothetical protein [Actinomycetota bacterium]